MAEFSNIVEAFSISHAQILTGEETFLEALASAYNEDTDVYGVNEGGLEPDLGSYDNEGDDTIMSTWDWINKAELTIQAGYVSFPLISKLTGQPVEILEPAAAVNAVQTLKSSGASAGTFVLSYGGQSTAPLTYSATAAAITTALAGLTTIGTGNVTATGGPASTTDVVITFGGTLAGVPVSVITVDGALLTDGTPSVVQTTLGKAAGKGGFGMDLWHEDQMNTAPAPMIIKMPSKDQHGNPADFVIGLYKVSFKPIQFDGPAYKDGLKINYDGTALQSGTDEKGVPFADGKKRFGRLLAIQK